jgi:glc operon protein GlcG
MRTKPCLTSADVLKLAAAAKAEANRNGWEVSIAIVDDGGIPFYLERMDGAAATTPDVALSKARLAALTRRPSKFWEDRVKERPGFANFPHAMFSQVLPAQGALPILYQGECVGAIGVSGVQSQDDERIAQAGLDALV